MKTKNMIWAALSMTAALVMTACSNDDNTVETPAAQQAEVKTIPYSVTVNGGASTRATVDSDNKTLRFATGDKLYITGTNISGTLDITGGTGTASATFSGDLTYTGGGSPASDLSLTATLVSAQQTDGTEVTINPTTKAVTVNYPTTAYCDDVATAVQKYSNLTGTSKYGEKSFTLKQQTAFLNFEITFVDLTAENTTLVTVVNNNSTDICTANVKTKKDGKKVVAKFVLPVAKGTTLSSANVKFGDKAAISFGASQTLTGKVYNVNKTYVSPLTLTSPAVGQVIGSDGKNYAYGSLPTGVTAVAKICYVSGSNGLALALTDEGEMNWNSAQTTCAAHTPPFTGGTWKLPSKDEWEKMISAAGNYTALRDGFSSVGGTNMKGKAYYSSTENASNQVWRYIFDNGGEGYVDKDAKRYARAVLAF